MNRREDFENGVYEEKAGVGRRSRKMWKSVTAIVAALVVAAIAVISVSAGADAEAAGEAQPQAAFLTLADSEADGDSDDVALTGFVITDVSDVVKDVLPSVVSITSRSIVNYFGNSGQIINGGDINDIFDLFFGDSYGGNGGRYYYREDGSDGRPREEQEEQEEEIQEIDSGLGSGTIIAQNDQELLILTSYHVVEGSSSLYVTFINDASVDGYIKAADEEKDIAIVAVPLADIDQDTINSIKIATISTEEPEVGDGCVVIGNALGYGISVTSGIVSALNREITVEGMNLTLIQTDAAINFGNSGGCMVNSRGEIIGIPEAKATISYVEGVCYAIPVVSNTELIQNLLNAEMTDEKEKVFDNETAANGGFLGIRGRDVTQELSKEFEMPQGVYVSSIVQGSGAEEAGIQSGDIIVGINGEAIYTMAELQYALGFIKAGDTAELKINRLVEGNYEEMTIEVTLTDRIS